MGRHLHVLSCGLAWLVIAAFWSEVCNADDDREYFISKFYAELQRMPDAMNQEIALGRLQSYGEASSYFVPRIRGPIPNDLESLLKNVGVVLGGTVDLGNAIGRDGALVAFDDKNVVIVYRNNNGGQSPPRRSPSPGRRVTAPNGDVCANVDMLLTRGRVSFVVKQLRVAHFRFDIPLYILFGGGKLYARSSTNIVPLKKTYPTPIGYIETLLLTGPFASIQGVEDALYFSFPNLIIPQSYK